MKETVRLRSLLQEIQGPDSCQGYNGMRMKGVLPFILGDNEEDDEGLC